MKLHITSVFQKGNDKDTWADTWAAAAFLTLTAVPLRPIVGKSVCSVVTLVAKPLKAPTPGAPPMLQTCTIVKTSPWSGFLKRFKCPLQNGHSLDNTDVSAFCRELRHSCAGVQSCTVRYTAESGQVKHSPGLF